MNAKIRSVIFWIHLVIGVAAGVIVLIMSVTGVLLTYEKQIVAWADRGYRVEVPAAPANTAASSAATSAAATPSAPANAATSGAQRLPVETLVASVRAAKPNVSIATVTLRPDPAEPVAMGAGRDIVYVNPYTGQVLGTGSASIRAFFQSVTSWHRWLAMQGEGRATGRVMTGAANLGFLFLVISGPYLWLPRRWTRPALKAVSVVNLRARGRARDFNWHNVFGFWLCIPLFLIVASGVVMSYPWANNLLYRAVGEEPPTRGAGPGGPGGPGGAGERPRGERAEGERAGGERPRGERAQGEQAGGDRPRGEQARNEARGEQARGEQGGRDGGARERPRREAAPVSLDGLDALVTRAMSKVDGWKTLTVRVPTNADAPVTVTIDQGTAGQPQYRGTLTMNARTGDEIRWETFADQSAGRRLRSWARFVHTGEYYGLTGQTIAGIASFVGALLVYTGLALSLRRLMNYIRRRGKISANEQETDTKAA